MTGPSTTDVVTCGCCGQDRAAGDVARLGCHPDIVVCGGCVRAMAGSLADRPSITTIFPVHDMAAARDFWTRAGLDVENYDAGYAFVLFDGAEIAHLDLVADLDTTCNAASCYVHVADPEAWHQRWAARGLPVTALRVEPWGMVEFSVTDPSGNRVRVGRPG